ncbi:hypothetical protein [Flavobacterium sandaracinum]|uniref:hypothetical protein n=1 Tax=Flavobacterium sandaracinum TaxID=2541733 RepID=UPI00140516C0|nr:hypothetical protein [Flavobacterium sandaracinum]
MKLLTTRKVAENLGFSTRYVCLLVKSDKIKPFAVLDNGHNVFTNEAIEAFKARKEAKDAK